MLSRKIGKRLRAITLPEMLVGMVILGVIASVAVPQSRFSENASKESQLKSTLDLVRRAVQQFRTDTGVFPAQLSDLTSVSLPSTGLDPDGQQLAIRKGTLGGPYLNSIPKDPMDWGALGYSTQAPNVGVVSSRHKGTDRNEIAYSDY